MNDTQIPEIQEGVKDEKNISLVTKKRQIMTRKQIPNPPSNRKKRRKKKKAWWDIF